MPLKWYAIYWKYSFNFNFFGIKLIFSLFTSKFKPALLEHLATIIS